MSILFYIFIGIITSFSVEFLSVNIGSALGAVPYEVGIVVTAISISCGILIVCTLAIIETIKKTNK